MAPDRAIEAWHQVLELSPGDMEALAALEDLYSQEARWNEAITVLESKVKVLEDTDSKIDVLMQIASIWEERLEDKMQAAGAYHRDPGERREPPGGLRGARRHLPRRPRTGRRWWSCCSIGHDDARGEATRRSSACSRRRRCPSSTSRIKTWPSPGAPGRVQAWTTPTTSRRASWSASRPRRASGASCSTSTTAWSRQIDDQDGAV